jgi:Transglycosylase-like domain
VKVRLVVLVLLAVLLLAAPASAHRSTSAPIAHAIDHLRWKTNELRQKAGRTPVRTNFLYRQIADTDYRMWVRTIWQDRLTEAWRLRALSTVWDRLARCETGGNWKHRNSMYQGGLGFYHGSWDAYRPAGFPREAFNATREQQIVVGKRILADVGWGAWPACSIRLGLR